MAALSKKFKFFNFCFSNGFIVYQKLWNTSFDFYMLTEFVLLNVEIEKNTLQWKYFRLKQ